MYGTVARFRLKPGMENQLAQLMREYETLGIPGGVGEYVYRMDADPNEYCMAVIFTDRESYWANARSPEQDARYRKFRALLERDPEWQDGEIVYAFTNATYAGQI